MGKGANPFERWGLDHLSPSSLNIWAEQESYWIFKYIVGFKDEAGPAAWRGSAVEAGLDYWLYKRDMARANRAALERFELDAVGLADDGTEKERAQVPPMLEHAMRAASELGPPVGRQFKVEYWFDGIEVPVIGHPDYEWEDSGLELKTTMRLPSEIRAGHARQISLYSAARQKPYRVLYATPTKAEFRELTIDEHKRHLQHLEWYAHAIRRVLAMFSARDDMARIFVPKFDHFLWKNEAARIAAREIWT